MCLGSVWWWKLCPPPGLLDFISDHTQQCDLHSSIHQCPLRHESLQFSSACEWSKRQKQGDKKECFKTNISSSSLTWVMTAVKRRRQCKGIQRDVSDSPDHMVQQSALFRLIHSSKTSVLWTSTLIACIAHWFSAEYESYNSKMLWPMF